MGSVELVRRTRVRSRRWHSGCVGRRWSGGRRGRCVLGGLLIWVRDGLVRGKLGCTYRVKRQRVWRLGGLDSSHSDRVNWPFLSLYVAVLLKMISMCPFLF